MVFNELKIYLPKFLSAESQKELYNEIKEFVNKSLQNRYYTSKLAEFPTIFQGDGLFSICLVLK